MSTEVACLIVSFAGLGVTISVLSASRYVGASITRLMGCIEAHAKMLEATHTATRNRPTTSVTVHADTAEAAAYLADSIDQALIRRGVRR